jgi:hypothetical protein
MRYKDNCGANEYSRSGNATIRESESQQTHWAEAGQVACANVTRNAVGTTFSRTAEWLFPLTDVTGV